MKRHEAEEIRVLTSAVKELTEAFKTMKGSRVARTALLNAICALDNKIRAVNES